MEFEWDEVKSQATKELRGFDFSDVTAVFLDPVRHTFADKRFDYGEERWITFGVIEGRVFVVAYTLRNGVYRIVSARKANQRERRRYYEHA